ncbi:YhgE/Pip domain-containing protein [Microbacterium sp. LjRoot45]|uniref:YhgE/Pip family protein n=1 Tax=Microbacterium sp. LjRoot45 TaxID=3342329 RepID=UPI003ECD58A3
MTSSTTPLERARSTRPVTWVTIVGVLLLPVLIGGILVAALYNPVDRLDSMRAAIVNNDEPVTIDDQYVPLGRQLSAGLVEGSDELESNLDWTISNTDDAREGLADGTYDAVITIPENFSAAATSTAPGGTPEQATIQVATAPDSLIVDDAITAQVTQTAATVLGQQLSETYLENVFLGFTTLGDKLGEAADGAGDLADGAGSAADGAVSLADGVTQLADGTGQFASGIRDLSSGAAELGDGAGGIASGASGIADGTSQEAGGIDALGEGADALGDGLGALAAATYDAQSGAQQIAAGVDGGADDLRENGIVPTDLTDLAQQTSTTAATAATAADGVASGLDALSDQCLDAGADPAFCDQLAELQTAADGSAQAAAGTETLAGYTSGGLDQFAAEAPEELAAQLTTIAESVRTLGTGLGQIGDGIDATAAGAGDLASGAGELASGAGDLADGAQQLSSGAAQLSAGAGAFADGAATAASGADDLASGADAAASGADDLADGVGKLADGTDELADGLGQATDGIPSYTDQQATDLATVVANPVSAEGIGTSLFGASAVPLLAVLALWFGSLGSFIALQAVPRHALSSRRPSALLAARNLAPAAGIGALQGLLVAGVVQLAAGYDWGDWSVFAVLAVVAGVAFAAVNQALVAVFGGAGRWIAALIGVLAVATGVVSTVPGVLASVAGLMPTAPAYNALLAALTPAGGVAAGVVGLLVWAALGFIATVVAVARRRTTSARALLASPA